MAQINAQGRGQARRPLGEADPDGVRLSSSEQPDKWVCSRCAVTARWMADAEWTGLPAEWVDEGDEIFCLGCRRVLAGDAAVAGDEAAVAGTEHRVKVRKAAAIEFEIRRRPEHSNGSIARACHTSAPAVEKARRLLG